MKRNQIILVVIGLLLVVGIFLLPRVLVNQEGDGEAMSAPAASGSDTSEDHEGHDHAEGEGHGAGDIASGSPMGHRAEMSESQSQRIAELKRQLGESQDDKKIVTFADSLAAIYSRLERFDSAAHYSQMVAEREQSLNAFRKSGDAYYEAFTFAMDAEKANAMGEKARENYSRVLEVEPGDLEVKTKMAMTYVSTRNPMKGIAMLREVIAADPDNELALFNLGMLSMQSNQYAKAVERFEKIKEVNPDNMKARFYLAMSHMQLGDKEKAREEFQKVKSMDSDPEVQAAVDSYLNEL